MQISHGGLGVPMVAQGGWAQACQFPPVWRWGGLPGGRSLPDFAERIMAEADAKRNGSLQLILAR